MTILQVNLLGIYSIIYSVLNYLLCDSHVHNWLSLDIGQSTRKEPLLLQALYHEIDCLRILGLWLQSFLYPSGAWS